jgi:hypothetical protein
MFGTYCRLNVHVLTSNLTVIRALRRKLRPESLTDPAKRDARKAIYREILAIHARQRALFIAEGF